MKKIHLIIFCLTLVTYSCKRYSSNKLSKDYSNLEGYTKLYYNSGNIESEGHFNNGIKNGFWKYYYSNGNIKKEGNYSQNIKNGFWQTYHENGKIESEGHYSNNKPYGFWKYYNKDHSEIKTKNL